MKKVKNIPTYYTFPGTKIFRDTTALPFADGGPLHDRDINGKLLNSTYAPQLGDMFREGGPFKDDIGAFDYAKSIYASQLGDYYKTGGMLKRADGSYSPRGLWDNIRTNAGSGKAPTKQMLAQEKKINKQYKKGGPLLTNLTPEEEKQFQQFYQSLPDNLMQDDPEYDIRGYWDSEGRPQEFNFNQPKEDDGYYHAYSINQNTGEYLKSPSHHTFQRAIDEDRKIGYRPVTNVQGRNIATENESIIPPQEQSFLANTQGPVNFKKGGKLKKENNTNSEFGNIDIAPEGTREYQLANQPKASNYDQQYVDKAIEAAKLMYEDIGIYDKDDFLWSKMQSAVNPTEVFKLAKSNIYNDAYGKDRRDKVNIFGAKHHGSQMSTTLMRYFDAAIPPDLYPHFQGSAGYGSDIVNKNIEEPVRREFTQLAMPTLQRLPAVTIQNNNYPEETPVFNRTFRTGGQFPRPYSLPEDSFKQGGRNLHNSVYASSPAQYPAVYNFGGTLKNNLATRQQMYMPLDHITRNGGSILSMSNTPEMSGEGKDLTVPDNAYYYANGGSMQKPWLSNLYPDGGGLFQRWRNKNAAKEMPVQQLPEMTVYGKTESAEEQKRLLDRLSEMQRAFKDMRKNAGYIPGSLNIKNKGSIAGLKHNIQIYSKELEHQKDITQEAQKTLNLLQKHDPENWRRKHVKDVIENPEAVNALRKLYATNKISSSQYRDFYDTFGKWTDQKTIQGTGPGAVYSGKKAQEEWGKSEHWKDFTDKINTAATAIPLIGAAGALVNPGSLSTLLSNPYVSGGMNAYGLYNLPHGINQTYNDFSKGNYGAGVFNGAMTALDATPIGGGIRYARNLIPGIKNVTLGNANISDLVKPVDLLQVRKDYAQGLINKNQYNTATMGTYYGDTNDAQQIPYWPTREASEVATRKKIQIPEEKAYVRTKLGGTRASVADRRVDNLSPKGLWTAHITNPDGTLKSKEEIQQIISELHAEDAFLKTEKQNVLNKIAAGYKNKEFIGRLPIIEHKQKSIYNLLDDAAAIEAHKESVPRPEEFDAAIKKLLIKELMVKK